MDRLDEEQKRREAWMEGQRSAYRKRRRARIDRKRVTIGLSIMLLVLLASFWLAVLINPDFLLKWSR